MPIQLSITQPTGVIATYHTLGAITGDPQAAAAAADRRKARLQSVARACAVNVF